MTSHVTEREQWFAQGVAQGHDFLIVATDTFDYDDYPVYCTKADLKKTVQQYDGPNMQKVMEVFDLKQPASRVRQQGLVRDDYAVA